MMPQSLPPKPLQPRQVEPCPLYKSCDGMIMKVADRRVSVRWAVKKKCSKTSKKQYKAHYVDKYKASIHIMLLMVFNI